MIALIIRNIIPQFDLIQKGKNLIIEKPREMAYITFVKIFTVQKPGETMRKHLLVTMTCFMGTAFAAELIPDSETMLTPATQLSKIVDAESQAREKLLEHYHKANQININFCAQQHVYAMSKVLQEAKRRNVGVTVEILALHNKRLGLSLSPEMKFLARLDYVIDKKSYESGRVGFADQKANFMLQYEYLVGVIQLIAEYDQVKDVPMIRSQSAGFQEMLPQLFEEAKKDFRGIAMFYASENLKEFLETFQPLLTPKNQDLALKKLEEILAEVRFISIGLEMSELTKDRTSPTDKMIALQKESFELPLRPDLKFVAKLNYIILKQPYDWERIAVDDLEAQFLHKYRCVKEYQELLAEYKHVQDFPEIKVTYAECVETLPSLFQNAKDDLIEASELYMKKKKMEYLHLVETRRREVGDLIQQIVM